MKSFCDLKVIKTNVNRRSTMFLRLSQKTASFLYEFLCKVEWNDCTNTICLRRDTYIAPLF